MKFKHQRSLPYIYTLDISDSVIRFTRFCVFQLRTRLTIPAKEFHLYREGFKKEKIIKTIKRAEPNL